MSNVLSVISILASHYPLLTILHRDNIMAELILLSQFFSLVY